jgi:hypothetical protein
LRFRYAKLHRGKMVALHNPSRPVLPTATR